MVRKTHFYSRFRISAKIHKSRLVAIAYLVVLKIWFQKSRKSTSKNLDISDKNRKIVIKISISCGVRDNVGGDGCVMVKNKSQKKKLPQSFALQLHIKSTISGENQR